MITKPTSNNTIVHNRLIRFILKVAVPARAELRSRPAIHLTQLFLSRPDLDTSIDAIGCQRACTVDVPLLKYLGLHLWVTSHKVIEGLDVWLGSEDGEGEVVVLEVETHAGEVDDGLDTSAAELLGVT